jgi:hypothetical protein
MKKAEVRSRKDRLSLDVSIEALPSAHSLNDLISYYV